MLLPWLDYLFRYLKLKEKIFATVLAESVPFFLYSIHMQHGVSIRLFLNVSSMISPNLVILMMNSPKYLQEEIKNVNQC